MHLMEGRAKAAAIYPKGLCQAVCRGTLSQARNDASDLLCMECIDQPDGIEQVCEVAFEESGWEKYWDETTGRELKEDLVKATRADEIATVRSMNVWTKVYREECLRVTGKPPVKLR